MNLPGKKILKETVKVSGQTLCVKFKANPLFSPLRVDPLSRISGRASNWTTLPADLPTYWLPDSNLDRGKAAADKASADKSSDFVRSLGEAQSSVGL